MDIQNCFVFGVTPVVAVGHLNQIAKMRQVVGMIVVHPCRGAWIRGMNMPMIWGEMNGRQPPHQHLIYIRLLIRVKSADQKTFIFVIPEKTTSMRVFL